MLEVMDPLQQPLFYYELHAHSTGADNNYIDEAKRVKSYFFWRIICHSCDCPT